ncbi:MAG: multiubiquitin domain-containing protein [Myxococcales bacterium]|nr:multiubiquitin domain-containing protein [Myxococcales bacterium]
MATEMEAEVDEIEIELHTQQVSGKEKAPKAKKYVIRVDKTKFTVEVSSMTGREILTLAGKTPVEQYKLTQKMHGGSTSTTRSTSRSPASSAS